MNNNESLGEIKKTNYFCGHGVLTYLKKLQQNTKSN